jgi:hypothetical protein
VCIELNPALLPAAYRTEQWSKGSVPIVRLDLAAKTISNRAWFTANPIGEMFCPPNLSRSPKEISLAVNTDFQTRFASHYPPTCSTDTHLSLPAGENVLKRAQFGELCSTEQVSCNNTVYAPRQAESLAFFRWNWAICGCGGG